MFGNIESSIEWTRMFFARSKCFCFHNKPLNYSVLLPPAAKANGLPWNFFHMYFLFFALSVFFGQAGTKHIIYLGRNISIMSCQKLFIYHFLFQWYPYKSRDEFWCEIKLISVLWQFVSKLDLEAVQPPILNVVRTGFRGECNPRQTDLRRRNGVEKVLNYYYFPCHGFSALNFLSVNNFLKFLIYAVLNLSKSGFCANWWLSIHPWQDVLHHQS